jgi:hypothetical protein
MAFCTLKGGLLDGKRRPFAEPWKADFALSGFLRTFVRLIFVTIKFV